MKPVQGPSTACSPFEVYEAGDVRALIEHYPLAWVCACGGDIASHLPLVGVFDTNNELIELIGHFMRSNPLAGAFAQNPRATIRFSGPNGYISPSQAGRRNWAPTWNYANVQVHAEIDVDPSFTAAAVDLLVDHVEQGMPRPWRAAELGERYELLMPLIAGFRARVTQVRAVFRLGQSEDPPTLNAILSSLPAGELADWMRRLNRGHPGLKGGGQ